MKKSIENRLCNAYVVFLNERSKFSGFEVVTMRELEKENGGTALCELKTADDFENSRYLAVDEPFYRVFGIYKQKELGRRSLGDFYHINDAVGFLEDITGLPVYIYSY
jgi:hypothetical protein